MGAWVPGGGVGWEWGEGVQFPGLSNSHFTERQPHVTCLILRKPAFGRLTFLIAHIRFGGLYKFSLRDACSSPSPSFFFAVTAVLICKPIICISNCGFWLCSGWDPELQIHGILMISLSSLLNCRGWKFSVGFCGWFSRAVACVGPTPTLLSQYIVIGHLVCPCNLCPDLSSLIGFLKLFSFFIFEFPIDPFYIAAKIWGHNSGTH